MALLQSSMNRSTRTRPESADPFAMQLALSRVHARLVPMQRDEHGYSLDPVAEGWLELPADRGFAGYGLSRALRMLLDVLRGLTALHDTFDAEGVDFAHGEVAMPQLRVDAEGVCRLIPLTRRHSGSESRPPSEAVGHLAPERLLGEAVDARADVFSAGVLLWEALAGRRLFTEISADAIVERLMGERLQMPQLPPELAWAIPLKSIAARALSVDPYQRFADCAELATAIAIVARERVATHAEIAAFFGPQLRSQGSVAQKRPLPTRSSTLPSVSLTVAPASVSNAPSSRNGFPLATPSARSVTPAPRAVTPVPGAVTLATPSTLAPDPAPPVRGPESPRAATPKSPFATLIGTGDIAPASHRRKTLTAVGTPASALTAADQAPGARPLATASIQPAAWPGGTLLAFSPAPTAASAVVARAKLESIPLSDVAKFRSWSPRNSLIALGLAAVLGIVTSFVIRSSNDAPGNSPIPARESAHAIVARTAPVVATPEPTPITEEHAPNSPPVRAVGPNAVAPASISRELRPAAKPSTPNKPAPDNGKDYGI